MTLKIKPSGKETLHGKKLQLEVAAPHHADYLSELYCSDDFMDLYRLAQDRNIETQSVIDRLNREESCSPSQLRRIEWIITKKNGSNQSGKIGLASLADYQPAHNRAELLLGIKEPEDRSNHAALEATLLVMEFAFQKAKLNKLVSFVYSYNKSAQKNTLHLGFKQEGLLRDHYYNFRTKEFIDLYQNGLLKKEFFENKKISQWSLRLLGRDITIPQHTPVAKTLDKEESEKSFKEALQALRVNNGQ